MEMIMDTMANIVMLLLSIAMVVAMNYLKTVKAKALQQTEKIANDEQRQLLNDAIYSLDNLAYKTVGAIEQKSAKALREAVKDGKADFKELEALGRLAVREVREQIKPEFIEEIEKNFGNFNGYLAKTIESTLLNIKNRGKS